MEKLGNFAAEDVVAYSKSVRAYEDRELYRESGYDDGLQDGEAIGIEKERIKSISLMASFGVSAEKIAKAYAMPLSEVKIIMQQLNN